jgi:hypothetical protein
MIWHICSILSEKKHVFKNCYFAEWHQGKNVKVKLEDIDKTNDKRNGMVRLNMLKRYMVKDGSDMTLVSQESQNADDSNKIYGGYCFFYHANIFD